MDKLQLTCLGINLFTNNFGFLDIPILIFFYKAWILNSQLIEFVEMLESDERKQSLFQYTVDILSIMLKRCYMCNELLVCCILRNHSYYISKLNVCVCVRCAGAVVVWGCGMHRAYSSHRSCLARKHHLVSSFYLI